MLQRGLAVHTRIAYAPVAPVCTARRVYQPIFTRANACARDLRVLHKRTWSKEREKYLTSVNNVDDKSTLRNREVDLYRTRCMPLTSSFFFLSFFFHAVFFFIGTSSFAVPIRFLKRLGNVLELLRNRMTFLALYARCLNGGWTYPCSIDTSYMYGLRRTFRKVCGASRAYFVTPSFA